jgi:hypothetical protein
MKTPFRLLAALLTFCIAAAAIPTAGLAAEAESGFFDLKAAVERAADGSTITLTNDAIVNADRETSPWIIDKNVTIDGNGRIVSVRMMGILLDADVTFKNMDLRLVSSDGRNAIIANGHSLTLDSVTTEAISVNGVSSKAHSINIFGGSLQKGDHENYFEVPSPGAESTITIRGNTNLQGSDEILGDGNIFAGSLSMGTFGENATDGPATNFTGNVTINIEGSKGTGSLGTIYAGGGQNRTPQGAISGKETTPNPEKYTVTGTVTITGTNALPDVDGAGATETNVIYKASPNTKPKIALANISSFQMEQGKLILGETSSLRDECSLAVLSGAELEVSKYTGRIGDFTGGGSLVLGKDQTLEITGRVEGQTTIGVGQILNGASGIPTLDHTYIKAPNSNADSFRLAPPNVANPPVLAFDGGNWTASAGSSSGDENLIASFHFVIKEVPVAPGEEAEFEMNATLANDDYKYLDNERLNVTVDWNTTLTAREDPNEEYAYIYTDPMNYYSAYVVDNCFCITTAEKGNHTIQVTLPTNATVGGKTLSDTATLIVTDNGTTPEPGPVSIPVPTANTGLKWIGAEQTGVNEGTGYTLTGHKGTNAGDYTATAVLEPNYQWNDGSRDDKTITWSIAKADGPAAPGNLTATAPTAAGGTDGEINGTTSAMEYAADTGFSKAQNCGDGKTTGLASGTYHVRVKETDTHEAGAYASITVPVPGAPTLQTISVNSTAHKTEYQTGEALDVTDLTIEAVYSDGRKQTVPVTANMVSGFDSTSAAENQILTIRYEGQTTTYTVKITGSQQPGETMYQVTVSNTGSDGTASGVYEYKEGADVTIQAGSKDGLTFAAWDAAGLTLADRNTPVVSFRMPANDVTLNAIWTPNGDTPAPGHTHVWDPAWKNNTSHHWHDCTASGCTLTDNSQKSGYAAHTAGDWVVIQAASSTQNGVRHKTCTVCGYETARESIPSTGGGSSSSGSSSSSSGSSSGSGSSNNTTTSVKNPDGSTTSTNVNKITGMVTETTRRPDGSKTVVETKKDGTVTTTDTTKDGSTVKTVARPNGTAETTIKQSDGITATIQSSQDSTKATVRIPSKVAKETPDSGITLPIPALSGENASVAIHTGLVRQTLVKIPVNGNDSTTIACLVNSDGTETILKTAVLSGGQMAVSVSDGATVRVRDNGKDFQDVRGHWAKNAIDFVTARELFTGKTSEVFAPDGTMSRTMLTTVLARLDGVDTSGGSAYQKGLSWAVSKGISDGRNPDSQITREQFVTMLYRCAGSPAVMGQDPHFSDAEQISAYARNPICWAVENGILSGYEDGSAAPKGKTTRAQAAAILARYVEFLNQQ